MNLRDEISEPMPIAALLRAAADGELDEVSQARLNQHLRDHPDDRRRINFEDQLRDACGRSFAGEAPRGLRRRIEASVPASTRVHEGRVGRGRRGLPAAGGRRRGARVAATLATAVVLVLGAVAVLQRAQTPGQSEAVWRNVAQFVAVEHETCEIDPSRAAKFGIERLDGAPERLATVLGRAPALDDFIGAGLEFRDAGECHLPGRGRSMHIRFVDQGGGTPVSLFVQQSAGSQVLMASGEAYRIPRPCPSAASRAVYAWRNAGLDYYLVLDDPSLWGSVVRQRSIPEQLHEVG